jgi:hypothetical protein
MCLGPSILGLACLAAMGTTAAPAAASSGWSWFRPPEQSFSVRLPAEIKKSRRTVKTLIGEISTDVWAASAEANQISVSITRLPAMAARMVAASTLYRRTLDSLMEELGAELGRVEEIRRGPFERVVHYRIPATAERPLQSGRALIGVHGTSIVVINGVSSAGANLDVLFAGISII